MNLKGLNIRAHTCFIGKTGYSAHARGFFRELAKHTNLRIRNYTWDDNPDYLTRDDMEILETITLKDGDNGYKDFPIKEVEFFKRFNPKTFSNDFVADVDIVLMDSKHHYFYDKYASNMRIAYTVWESTRIPNDFFDVLLENFDYVWVVTEWHKKVLSEQGYPEGRIWVVREGVDSQEFTPVIKPKTNPMQFLVFGRWDYRKSIPEIIRAFDNAFGNDSSVELVLNVDNPYSMDGFSSTEERLKDMGITNSNIRVLHFLNRKDYVNYMCGGNVFVSCARSEGWNIPLLEAMVAGTPALYSDYGAQLEFAQGIGVPIDMSGFSARYGVEYPQNFDAVMGDITGYYGNPNYADLEKKLKYVRDNYNEIKEKALKDSEFLRKEFSWSNVVKDGLNFFETINEYKSRVENECVIILTHADNKRKEGRLSDLNKAVQKNGYYTIISSHIPTQVSGDINIVDYDNPVIQVDNGLSFFAVSNNAKVTNPFKFNHGYAAVMLMRNGLAVARERGYNKCHFINYDYFVRDFSVLKEHSIQLDNNDCIFYTWGNENEYNTGFFSAKTETLYEALRNINSEYEYTTRGFLCESFMKRVCDEFNINPLILRQLPSEVLANMEKVSTHPKIELGSDYIYYNFNRQSDDNIILSFVWFVNIPLICIVSIGRYNYQFTLGVNRKNDIHFLLNNEEYDGDISIKIPTFEVETILDNSSVGDLELYNNYQPIRIKDVGVKNLSRKININNVDGLFVEIIDKVDGRYEVDILDDDKKEVVYSTILSNNTWCRTSRKWYTKWRVIIKDLSNGEVIHNEIFSLKGRRVLISFESSSLGDTTAWIPYLIKFAKKHDCRVIASTFINQLFLGVEDYKDYVEFITPGSTAHNISAAYRIGWFYDGNSEEYDREKHPNHFRDQEMQKTATDILGLDFEQIRPVVVNQNRKPSFGKKYICIAPHSTAQAKYWNYKGGWQQLVDMFRRNGYEVVLISKEQGEYMGNEAIKNVIDKSGDYPLMDRVNDLRHAALFIGLGSGLSWLAWSCNTPVVTISGFSYPYTEFSGDDVVRIFNPNTCNGCFNRRRLDASDWMWCPDHKNTPRQFECTKLITPDYVYNEIIKSNILKDA